MKPFDLSAGCRKRFPVWYEERERRTRSNVYVLLCLAGPVIAWLGYVVGEAVMR